MATQKFRVGDRVHVLSDEGYDLKPEVQGKRATITAKIGESEYEIITDDGVIDTPTFYHLELLHARRVVPPDAEPVKIIMATDYPGDESYPWAGTMPPRLIVINADMDQHYVVVVGSLIEDCYTFVTQHYPTMTRERQLIELSNVDEWGGNDEVCVNYIAYDAPGWNVAYAMQSLSDVNYDLAKLVEDYFAP